MGRALLLFQEISKSMLLLFTSIGFAAFSFAQKSKPNILFIIVDDLKPALGCYGNKVVHSPNIDKLASTSTTFTSAYCQQAICGPTRASLLTGLRPDRTKIWDLKAKLREANPDVTTLPAYFKSNGYTTIALGKVFDQSNVDRGGDSLSWSIPIKNKFKLAEGFKDIAYGIYQSPAIKLIVKSENNQDKDEQDFYGPNKNPKIRYATECLNVPDDAYLDGAMADYAIDVLSELEKSRQPFFMAIGFKKPHLPFIAPKKYWDLYDRSTIELAEFQDKALYSPEIAYHNAGELRSYSADLNPISERGNNLKLTSEKQRELIHGYYACISYTDAQIGKLVNALNKSNLINNTIIVIIGDHGWHLGDHSLWCKHSVYEQAVRTPLIVKAPGITNGKKFEGLVEFVDIYPTLCILAGLPISNNLDGISLMPALLNSDWNGKEYAVSQYPRGAGDGAKEVMGYSLRTKQFRFTEWVNGFTTNTSFYETNVQAIELYDYQKDPLETENIANRPDMTTVLADLRKKLHQFYKSSYEKAYQSLK